MQLGTFKKDPKTEGFTGDIRTLEVVISGVTIMPAAKRSDNAPDFRVYSATGSDFGAGWNKISRDQQPYISIMLCDPAFNGGRPLYPILIEGQNGEYVLAWEAADAAKAAQRPAATPAQVAEADAPAPGGTTKKK